MHSQCNEEGFGFHAIGRRELVGVWDGNKISSDGRALLLREVELRLRVFNAVSKSTSYGRGQSAEALPLARLSGTPTFELSPHFKAKECYRNNFPIWLA